MALIYLAASAVAVWLGWQVGEGAYAWPGLAAVVALMVLLVRLTALPGDVLLLGGLIAGYLVGNRGFAQLMIPGLPLLPAELVLAGATGWRLVVWAFERESAFRSDALNRIVLTWLVVGAARVAFDVPRHGLLAVRDFAMVYYAVFFFLAQHMARTAAARDFLVGCLRVGLLVLLPVHALSQLFPRFFLTQLTVRGLPLIYFKGDLAVGFLAIAALFTFHLARGGHRFWAWPLATGLGLYVLASDSRASLFGLAVAVGWLLLARRWRFPACLGTAASVALLALVLLGTLGRQPWAERKLAGFTDRIQSVADPLGTRRYTSEESRFKGDNNRFRFVWWRNVCAETMQTNPVLGLGFGADLAHDFVREYYPDSNEEFNTRSPHNFFLTTFGRMGAVGLAVWLGFCAVLAQRTWRGLRQSAEPADWCLWCGVWVLLASATFGVVLEGPMGAVLFWSMLGLANTPRGLPAVATGEESRHANTASLPVRAARA